MVFLEYLDPSYFQKINFNVFEGILEGRVTKVNESLLFFELDKKYKVFVNATHKPLILPSLEEKIRINDPEEIVVYEMNKVVLGPKSEYGLVDGTSWALGQFSDFLNTNSWGQDPKERILIDLILDKLQQEFSFLRNKENEETLLLPSIVALGNVISNSKIQSFECVSAMTPKDLIHLDDSAHLQNYFDYSNSDYAVNVYPNRHKDDIKTETLEYLFGILYVSETYGQFLIKDDNKSFLVKFTKSTKNLHKLQDSFVLITKYTIFVETFKSCSQKPLNYLLIEQDDVIVIKFQVEGKRPIFYEEYETIQKGHLLYMQMIKKSDVICGYQGKLECWLECLITTENLDLRCQSDIIPKGFYAIIPEEHLQVVPFLNSETIYKIHSTEFSRFGNVFNYKELNYKRKYKEVILIASDSLWQQTTHPLFNNQCQYVFKDFNYILHQIANGPDNAIISFQLKLTRKVFTEKKFRSFYGSRVWKTKKPLDGPECNFWLPLGDIDNLQQSLVFTNNFGCFIDVYLTNRENFFYPLAVCENMVIQLNHVEVMKRRYLKSTIFTSIDIISFSPPFRYSSAVLNSWMWPSKTPRFPIALFQGIPQNTIVHEMVSFVALYDLNLIFNCSNCGADVSNDSCVKCDNSAKELRACAMVIKVQGKKNTPVLMEINDLNFLLQLIGFDIRGDKEIFICECENWEIKNIDFTSLRIPEHVDVETEYFWSFVDLIKNVVNYRFNIAMCILCRRQKVMSRKPWEVLHYRFCNTLWHIPIPDVLEI